MDWNTVESCAGSTGMCLSDRPVMIHADGTQAHKLQRLLLKSYRHSPWPMCRTSDAVGIINLGDQVQPKSFRSLISNGYDLVLSRLLAELRWKNQRTDTPEPL